MNYLDWGTIIVLVSVAGFLWRLTHTVNRDLRNLEKNMTDEIHTVSEKVSNLAERVATIEGALFKPTPGLGPLKSE
ncbi:MAG: hypothetical protein OXD43_08535 [Bacteroidetes bacterium]|nr:hypothetical protein [Bacteroidota bacterium]